MIHRFVLGGKRYEELHVPVATDRISGEGLEKLMETLRLVYPGAEVFWDGDKGAIVVRWVRV